MLVRHLNAQFAARTAANLRDRKEAFARSRPEDCKARFLSLCAARKPPIRRGRNGRDRSGGRHGDIEDSSSFDDLHLPRRDQPSSPHDVIEGWVPFLRLPGIHAGDTHEQGSGNVQKPHLLRGCRRILPTGPASCTAIYPVAGGRPCCNGFGKRAIASAMARNS
jgi:hypothetical protein